LLAATASAASPLTSRVLADDNGASSVEENTTWDDCRAASLQPSR